MNLDSIYAEARYRAGHFVARNMGCMMKSRHAEAYLCTLSAPKRLRRMPFNPTLTKRSETAMSPTAARKPGAIGIRAKQAQDTRAKILKAAIKVFAKQGFASGRVESISKAARSHDRMIYYYFGSKEQLFVEVLETIYAQFNEAESKLDLDLDDPAHGLEQMVEFVWQYYLDHPEFVTLLSSENLHQGKHAKKSLKLKEISGYAISVVQKLLDAGQAQNVFRADVKARDVYLMIASLGYFYNANQYTLGAFLGEALMDKAALAHWREVIKDTVLRAVRLQLPAETAVMNESRIA
ncbi:TetR family transcriptional regulator [Paraburkholderia sp. BL23I1N1]|nr:TetR family transcriptional regulator [Paraburkholderia sp. BL23I1N1]